MTRKKTESKKKKKTPSKTKPKKTKTKSTKKSKKSKNDTLGDGGIIIVDDELEINKDKEIEERRAYLEEARSQEAFD